MREQPPTSLDPPDARSSVGVDPPTASAESIQAFILTDERDATPYLDDWDRLAVRCSRPYMTPAWTLAWWRHLRPSDACLRIVVVARNGDVIGVIPLYGTGARPSVLRMLGLPFDAPKDPLAAPGDEGDVAEAALGVLRRAHRPADAMSLVLGADDGWRSLLARVGPGSYAFDRPVRAVPRVPIEADSYDAWLASKSRNFRQQMRRARRGFEKEGGRFGLASTPEEAVALLEPLLALHAERWRSRGGSSVLRTGLPPMLADAVGVSAASDRARVWYAEIEGRVVSAHLFVAAGDRSSYWLGGFDDRYASFHPGMLCLLDEIAHAFDHDVTTVDLGPGQHPYKDRIASDLETVVPTTFVVRGAGYARRRLMLAPHEIASAAALRLPQEWRKRAGRTVRSGRRALDGVTTGAER